MRIALPALLTSFTGIALATALLLQPALAAPLSDITSLAAGASHTCALTRSGGIRCWGFNGYGQLGDGSTINRLLPVAVGRLGSDVSALAAGDRHSCALTSGGAVWCWGKNELGQLGDGSNVDRLTPVQVSGLPPDVTTLAAGIGHTCVLTRDGAVKCWGDNTYGQLGDGSTSNRLSPVSVSGLGSGVTALAAGSYQTCAIPGDGVVRCWGKNDFGQLGDGSTSHRSTPAAVVGLGTDIAALAMGTFHTCALSRGGAVQCWGNNASGQLGDNSTTARLTPATVSGLASGVTALVSGGLHNCVLLQTGAVYCWGYNGLGQMGNGSTLARHLAPGEVSGLSSGVIALAAGNGHTCAVTSTGAVRCWGENAYGQLGDHSSTSRYTPVAVLASVDAFTGKATGTISATSLSMSYTPTASQAGQSGGLFVLAYFPNLGGAIYCYGSTSGTPALAVWMPYTGISASCLPFSRGTLSAATDTTVFSGLDLAGASGTQLLAGAGIGSTPAAMFDAMLAETGFNVIHTVP